MKLKKNVRYFFQLANMNIFLRTIRDGTFAEMDEVSADYAICQNREMDGVKTQMQDVENELKACMEETKP